jgi:L-rhamnose mutarotase
MERIAFKMQLKPGHELEYKKRHDEIWPEVKSVLKKVGIRDYSIFLDKETNTLFGIFKASNKNLLEKLPDIKVMRDWWIYMEGLMETNTDSSPVSTLLKEVFYLL